MLRRSDSIPENLIYQKKHERPNGLIKWTLKASRLLRKQFLKGSLKCIL